ncbi:MAG: apolipoprotein N-acyltransferase [Acidimicrobiia bacterium]
MKAVLLALAGGLLSFLAFPPFGPGLLIFPGIALFLWAMRQVTSPRQGFWIGLAYGLVFFGGLMWWLVNLELLALILIPVQALFVAVYGWWLSSHRDSTPGIWLALAVGGWAAMELIRYRYPVGGLEWGAVGYALSDNALTRAPAAVLGTTGLTVLVVLIGSILALLAARDGRPAALWGALVALFAIGASYTWIMFGGDVGPAHPVTIVQGSTPCPFEHCAPNERLRTYEQHLALTEALEPGAAGLVVWPEGSTGSTNADPVLNDEIRTSIAEEARRLGSPMIIGGDRILNDTEWVNANVYFDAEGDIVGEYRKQHPVPFGEYIPLRPLFDWIPALNRVPRDMIPGDGPVVIDGVGSVISFEGGFSRYALETRRAGAKVIVVNTNEASYGPAAPTSDQFIGMTRMRAVELGVPVVHAAVTGKSVVIDVDGSLGPETGLGTMEVLQDEYGGTRATPYTVYGDAIMYLATFLGILGWSRSAAMVGSSPMQSGSSSMPTNSAPLDQED